MIAALAAALGPKPWARALWEGGSAAFGRVDEWSDIDVQAEVEDAHVAEAFASAEAAVRALVPIARVFEVPAPTWHGHGQKFYQLSGQPAWYQLDFVVMQAGNPRKFLEREIHGDARFLFDKVGLAGRTPPLDRAAWETKLRARIAAVLHRQQFFAPLAAKEAARGQAIDALNFFNGLVVGPLVELLRLRHDPWRHDFGLRYLHRVLPPADAARLQRLAFVPDAAALPERIAEAVAWGAALAEELAARPALLPPGSDRP